MNAKEYLSQYRNLSKQLDRVQIEIDELIASVESSALIGDGLPKATNGSDRVANVAVRLAELRSNYQYQLAEMWEKRKEIVMVIHQVGDAVYSELLYDRYIRFMKWNTIAETMHMDESYTRGRLHEAALKKVDEIINKQQKATNNCDIV